MGWKWKQLIGGRYEPTTTAEIVLYTRNGCHLCDNALATLTAAAQRYALTLRMVDVDSDAELAKRHGLQVPVVEIDGRVRFRGCVNAVLLERLLSKRN